MNENNIAMYDALKAKFANHDIYCPTPVELTNKLLSMAQWNYRWKSAGNNLEFTIDFSKALSDTLPYFTGGMGIKIDNTSQYIQKVSINGKDHWAFSEQVVILPNLKKGTNTISITLGPVPSPDSRLIYSSSFMPSINKKGDNLEVSIQTKSKARVKFSSPSPAVLLNADGQEWNRKGDAILSGYVNSDRNLILRPIEDSKFSLTKSSVPIKDFKQNKSTVTLTITPTAGTVREIYFSSQKPPVKAVFGNQNIPVSSENNEFMISLPEYTVQTDLTISLQ
jgi:hypothetical protein